MLDSLSIRNYRNLKNLRITSLGRVNLITGKNNTGKSTILESIAIYAAKGDMNVIYQLLEERGEYSRRGTTSNSIESNIVALSSLFTNRLDIFDAISIGRVENNLFGEEQLTEDTVTLRFVEYFDEVQNDSQGVVSRRRVILQRDNEKQFSSSKVGFEIREGNRSRIVSLDESYRVNFKGFGKTGSFQFINTRNIDREINGKLFDSITLTEKEEYVIDALRIIEPSTERIAFVEETSRERAAVIKLSNIGGGLPLRSMGDGINRILTIILALVNSDNGFLLIDEFENGLHYTVQEQLWKIVFSLAQKLNIQVFVTTHSEDCISGFENVLNNFYNSPDGKLIRLDNVDGTIKQVEFNADELRIASNQNIETR